MPARRLKVWQVIQALQDFEGAAERMGQRNGPFVNRRPVEELLREHPFLQVMRMDLPLVLTPSNLS